MARNEILSLTAGSTVELSAADITRITFQNHGPGVIEVIATTGATPTAAQSGPRYTAREGEAGISLSDLAPGVAGAVRLFARTYKSGASEVFVSHA